MLERFFTALDKIGANATDLPDYVDNLHRVERDFYGVAETAIELPSWCER